jgi:hypothetical protein
VEKNRPDVEITYRIVPEQTAFALERSRQGHPVFLAAIDGYYDLDGLGESFRLEPAGPLFRLRPR